MMPCDDLLEGFITFFKELQGHTELTFTCSEAPIEAIEKSLKYVQN